MMLAAALCIMGLPAAVRAQVPEDYAIKEKSISSPETAAIEARIGPYTPEVGANAFGEAYPGDHGLLLGLELDVIALRVPNILYLCPAIGFGYAGYDGKAFDESGEKTDEETTFHLIQLPLLAVLRVDALARELSVPLIITGKIGYRWSFWDSNKGGKDEDDGVDPAWVWAGQIALDLDLIDPRSARLLDEDWGINHTFVFFEVFGSKSVGDGLSVDDTTWTAGLGLVI